MAFSILVCIKVVPEWSATDQPVPQGKWILEEDLAWCVNIYDQYALETALVIKDSEPDIRVDVLSVGPDRVHASIRRALAMGADHGIQLKTKTGGTLPPDAVAEAVCRFAQPRGYGIIFTGAISEDAMQGATGPMIAAAMAVPCAAAALAVRPQIDEGKAEVLCEMEGGMSERVELSLPAVVTIQSGGNPPRYPTLSNTIRSRRQEIEIVDAKMPPSLGFGSEAIGLSFPERTADCRIIDGTLEQKADRLLALFSEKGWLK